MHRSQARKIRSRPADLWAERLLERKCIALRQYETICQLDIACKNSKSNPHLDTFLQSSSQCLCYHPSHNARQCCTRTRRNQDVSRTCLARNSGMQLGTAASDVYQLDKVRPVYSQCLVHGLHSHSRKPDYLQKRKSNRSLFPPLSYMDDLHRKVDIAILPLNSEMSRRRTHFRVCDHRKSIQPLLLYKGSLHNCPKKCQASNSCTE